MTHFDQKFLVLGATGRQGRAVAQHLLKRGFINVYALVRTTDSPNTQFLVDQGIKLELGNLDESAQLQAAMRDAYGVFAALPLDQFGLDTEIQRGKNAADAAKKAGVQHFIYSSAAGADRSEGVADFYAKHVVEEHIRELDLPASIVRPAAFMDNLLGFPPMRVNGVVIFRLPIRPEVPRQQIATNDIGMIVADQFARPDQTIGQTLEIAGDELTGPQMVEIYTKVTGLPARYEVQPIEEAQAFNQDFAKMLDWQNTHSFGADLAHLRAMYPQLTTFEAWLTQHHMNIVPQE